MQVHIPDRLLCNMNAVCGLFTEQSMGQNTVKPFQSYKISTCIITVKTAVQCFAMKQIFRSVGLILESLAPNVLSCILFCLSCICFPSYNHF